MISIQTLPNVLLRAHGRLDERHTQSGQNTKEYSKSVHVH